MQEFSLRQPTADEVRRFLEQHGFELELWHEEGESAPDCARAACSYVMTLERAPFPHSAYDDAILPWGSERLDAWSRFLGMRVYWLSIQVTVRQGELQSASYGLMLVDYDHYRGISLFVEQMTKLRSGWSLRNVSPDFRPRIYPRYGDRRLVVSFTPAAPRKLVKQAYSPDLSCLNRLGADCTMQELVPELWHSRLELVDAAERLRNSEAPCPLSVVRGRVRDADAVILAELVQRSPTVEQEDDEWHHGDYRTVEVLKGEWHGRLDRISHAVTVARLGPTSNAATQGSRLLRLGDHVFFFLEDPWPAVDRECEAMPATPEVIAEVEKAIAEFKPRE